MRPRDIFSIAFKGITGNKLRAVLTILGVVIGVGAVIAVMSIGRGSSAAITEQIESIGTNLIFVRPAAASADGVRGAQGSAQTLTLQDAEALDDPSLTPHVAVVAPQVGTFAQARAGSQNVNTRVLGITPAYGAVRSYQLAEGEFITEQDVASRTLTAVLGSSVAQTLFGLDSPIGQRVIINQRAFQVVGVLESKGSSAQGLEDDQILVPITTAQLRLVSQRTSQGGQNVQSITLQATSKDDLEAAKQEIAEVLRARHRIAGEDDFTITTQQDLVDARTEVTDVLTILLGSIAGISLVVGGIGIMNIMLVSVTERTREIGLRKAIGAKRRHILAQFLGEATILSLTGGGLGVGAGWGVARMLEHLTLNGQRVRTLVSMDIALIALGVAVGIGLFFGIYPAFRASRMDPIEALRYQ